MASNDSMFSLNETKHLKSSLPVGNCLKPQLVDGRTFVFSGLPSSLFSFYPTDFPDPPLEILEPTPFREGASLQPLPNCDSSKFGLVLEMKKTTQALHTIRCDLSHISSSSPTGKIDQRGSSTPPSPNSANFTVQQDTLWEGHFQDLLKFKATHGHCLVPHTYKPNPSFARWAKRQRFQYKLLRSKKSSAMSKQRLKRLESVGFVWDPQSIAWEARLQDLVEFKAEHGHCNVPCRYSPNTALGAWVKRQRRQYKQFKRGASINISPDRFRILSEMGFNWEFIRPR